MAYSLWGDPNVEWSESGACGASGGIIILWRKGILNINFSFRGVRFVDINAAWKGQDIFFVNVYSYCLSALKRRYWGDLVAIKSRLNKGSWIVGGDFNAVSRNNERIGASTGGRRSEIQNLCKFIEDLDCINVPCIGGIFTWFSGYGSSMSRLDRILILEELVMNWSIVGQIVGKRDISDHYHIWLKSSSVN
ncbi:unnamed protein product [Lathyrus sativus]|nr:unnamed protein product [Lathyrus sativus]